MDWTNCQKREGDIIWLVPSWYWRLERLGGWVMGGRGWISCDENCRSSEPHRVMVAKAQFLWWDAKIFMRLNSDTHYWPGVGGTAKMFLLSVYPPRAPPPSFFDVHNAHAFYILASCSSHGERKKSPPLFECSCNKYGECPFSPRR